MPFQKGNKLEKEGLKTQRIKSQTHRSQKIVETE